MVGRPAPTPGPHRDLGNVSSPVPSGASELLSAVRRLFPKTCSRDSESRHFLHVPGYSSACSGHRGI